MSSDKATAEKLANGPPSKKFKGLFAFAQACDSFFTNKTIPCISSARVLCFDATKICSHLFKYVDYNFDNKLLIFSRLMCFIVLINISRLL